MELYAAGFNAWRQLDFGEPRCDDEPADVTEFCSVMSEANIEKPSASLSWTLVRTSSGLRTAGFDSQVPGNDLRERLALSTAAIAGNGLVAVYDDGDVNLYPSLTAASQQRETCARFPLSNIRQLVAFETGFAALSREGQVWTWGDERYPDCLGRPLTTLNPAHAPGVVEELANLPTGKIMAIAAGGYTLAALTEGNDLYAWGGHPGRPPIVEGISSDPEPLLVGDGDVVDVAVGQSHIIALTDAGQVFVAGDNHNHQLGVPFDKTTEWVQIVLPFKSTHAVVRVGAGPRCSFILTKRDP